MKSQTLHAIRDRILSGDLRAASWIKQDQLAIELGVSKIPVREALRQLEQDGLVTSQLNRGFFVRPMIASEAEDIFALRLKIEPDAVLHAARAASAAEQQEAILAHKNLRDAIVAKNSDVTLQNRAFHLALVRPSRRLVTSDLIERLHILAERYVRIHLQPSAHAHRANQEHKEILDAWLAKDLSVAALTRAHISETLKDLRLQLRTKPNAAT
jgi:DNA-binding GntR family transcriptional regulator